MTIRHVNIDIFNLVENKNGTYVSRSYWCMSTCVRVFDKYLSLSSDGNLHEDKDQKFVLCCLPALCVVFDR